MEERESEMDNKKKQKRESVAKTVRGGGGGGGRKKIATNKADQSSINNSGNPHGQKMYWRAF